MPLAVHIPEVIRHSDCLDVYLPVVTLGATWPTLRQARLQNHLAIDRSNQLLARTCREQVATQTVIFVTWLLRIQKVPAHPFRKEITMNHCEPAHQGLSGYPKSCPTRTQQPGCSNNRGFHPKRSNHVFAIWALGIFCPQDSGLSPIQG